MPTFCWILSRVNGISEREKGKWCSTLQQFISKNQKEGNILTQMQCILQEKKVQQTSVVHFSGAVDTLCKCLQPATLFESVLILGRMAVFSLHTQDKELTSGNEGGGPSQILLSIFHTLFDGQHSSDRQASGGLTRGWNQAHNSMCGWDNCATLCLTHINKCPWGCSSPWVRLNKSESH